MACATVGVGAVGANQALASHSQATYFEGSADLLNPATRPHALDQLQTLGVRTIRVVLYWHDVAPAPDSATRPSFDATDPVGYSWGQYDELITAAAQQHFSVLLTVSAPAPRWATAAKRDLVTRPDAAQFGQFMTAIGRHFSSRVSLFSIWNEPNHPDYLKPQFAANRTPASPRLYRALFQQGYNGLRAAGIAHPKVLMGETAPTGSATNSGNHDVAPLVFLRGVLCLNAKYKKSGSCSSLPAYGYAHHGYTNAGGPFYKPISSQDVTIGVLSRLTRALDKAARAHAIKSHMNVYLTEFGVQSKPNRYLGVPVAQQAEYDAISERIAYQNPRVAAFSQYLLRDDPVGGAPGTRFIGFQTGLEYVDGRPKPLYLSFPVPLAVTKPRHGHTFSLWGLARPTSGATKVTVYVQARGAHSFKVLKTVSTDSRGYWSLKSGTQGTRWFVRWTSPAGVVYSGPPIRAYSAF
ncbi:MAG TPA: hypothetical protein VLJ42_02455 [Solirubrobacteraceae bacterium]|nr:hypothetical protein [Solirubrobacteraceae bacterium]